MANLYSVFKDLLPDTPLLIGTVESSDGDVHVVRLLDGGVSVARGSASVGDRVFLRDGAIEGTAPTLELQLIEI